MRSSSFGTLSYVCANVANVWNSLTFLFLRGLVCVGQRACLLTPFGFECRAQCARLGPQPLFIKLKFDLCGLTCARSILLLCIGLCFPHIAGSGPGSYRGVWLGSVSDATKCNAGVHLVSVTVRGAAAIRQPTSKYKQRPDAQPLLVLTLTLKSRSACGW